MIAHLSFSMFHKTDVHSRIEVLEKLTGWSKKNGHPFHRVFGLFLIILGKSDERMQYWLGLGDSFAILYIAVTYLVQELYWKMKKGYISQIYTND